MIDRFLRGVIRRDRIESIDGHAAHAIARGAIGHARNRHLLFHRHRDGVFVILDDDDERKFVDARPGEGFVEIALIGGAFAEARHGDPIAAAQFLGQCHPGGLRHLRRHGAGDAVDVLRFVRVMLRHLPPAGTGIALLAEDAQHHVERRHAAGQHHRHVAIVRQEVILAAPHGKGDAHLRGFMSHAGNVKSDLALPVQNPAALVQTTRAQHGGVHVQQQIGGQSSEGRSRRFDGGHDHLFLPWVVGCEQQRPTRARH